MFHLFVTSFCVTFVVFTSSQSVTIKTQGADAKENFISNSEEFLPTDQWQIVKEGQAIPAGLHIRLNLETGVREAKLLDSSPSNDLIPVNDSRNESTISIAIDRSQYSTRSKMANENISTLPNVAEFQTDPQIIIDLFEKLIKNQQMDQLKHLLTDFEYYLHQYDNAVLFANRNGLEFLLSLLHRADIDADTRSHVLWALSAAFQGNPQVQLKGVELGFVESLLNLLDLQIDKKVQVRCLSTLSALLRHSTQAQQRFLHGRGIEIFLKLFDQSFDSQRKIIEFFTDLIDEKRQAMEQQSSENYESLNFQEKLVEHHWCSRLSTNLISLSDDDFEQIEKTLLAMIPFTDACHSHLIAISARLDRLHHVYRKETPDGNPQNQNLRIIIEELRQIIRNK